MAVIRPRTWKTKRGDNFTIRAAGEGDAGALLELSRAVMAEDIYSMTKADELDLTD
jgi:hypothetical protein